MLVTGHLPQAAHAWLYSHFYPRLLLIAGHRSLLGSPSPAICCELQLAPYAWPSPQVRHQGRSPVTARFHARSRTLPAVSTGPGCEKMLAENARVCC